MATRTAVVEEVSSWRPLSAILDISVFYLASKSSLSAPSLWKLPIHQPHPSAPHGVKG